MPLCAIDKVNMQKAAKMTANMAKNGDEGPSRAEVYIDLLTLRVKETRKFCAFDAVRHRRIQKERL